jgi:hypothetical protein
MAEEIRSGIWQHYKGKYYNVLGVGRHTETGELGVVYTPLYVHPNGGPALQFRPLEMWTQPGLWEVDGKRAVNYVPRFTYVGQEMPPQKSS